MRFHARFTLALIAFATAAASVSAARSRSTEVPETVIVTLTPKPGSEDALARTIARHWDTARRLDLVRQDMPHITLRGSERGKPYFLHIFTWRDESIPDAAPPEILTIWDEMNRLVEKRDGRPGLTIKEMTPIAP